MVKFFGKLLTLGEILLGSALLIGAFAGALWSLMLNILMGIAGFFILADGLEHIDDPKPNDNNNNNTPAGAH